jgi:Nucleotide modification associated domain 2
LRLFSYVVARDYGFAPNPFFGVCTLATCKPGIRGAAEVGDWVVGTGTATRKRAGYLVFVMNVEEAMSFDEYWADPRLYTNVPT